MAGQTGLLKNLKISTKVILSGLVITALFIGTTFFWLLPSAEKALIARKKEKIKEATEIAWSVLNFYHEKETSGEMNHHRAQLAAAKLIEGIRFGPEMKDYFWINDTFPRIVMHPYRKDLNQKDVSNYYDLNGKALFVEFVKVAVQEGEGFVEYLWQWQDDAEKIVPKISYVRFFRPWGWILGTGMYIEDVKAEIRRWKMGIIILYSLLALIGAVLSGLTGQKVAQAIRMKQSNVAADEFQQAQMDEVRVFSIKLRTYILAIMIPLLIGLTIYWSFDLYQHLYGIILEGFDAKLRGVSSTIGIFIPGEEHKKIIKAMKEDHPLYQKHIKPMRRVLEKTGLTYLYTQILLDRSNHCIYIFDATMGEDYSEIGTRDELDPKDYNAALKVMLHGIVHISDVEHIENWGLLKYAYAPIWNRDGSVEAIAGADVNIGAIRMKTRTALFSVFIMALIALAFGAYLSLLISNSLTRPIGQLKEWALKVAAGSYKHIIPIEKPFELKKLALEFGRLGSTMEKTIKSLNEDYRNIEKSELEYKLTSLLDRHSNQGTIYKNHHGTFQYMNNLGAKKTVSGFLSCSNGMICWFANPIESSLEAVKIRNDFSKNLHMIQFKQSYMIQNLLNLFSDCIHIIFIYDFSEKMWQALPQRPFDYLLIQPNSRIELQQITTAGPLTIQPQQSLLCWDTETLSYRTIIDKFSKYYNSYDISIESVLQYLDFMVSSTMHQVFTGVIHGTHKH